MLPTFPEIFAYVLSFIADYAVFFAAGTVIALMIWFAGLISRAGQFGGWEPVYYQGEQVALIDTSGSTDASIDWDGVDFSQKDDGDYPLFGKEVDPY